MWEEAEEMDSEVAERLLVNGATLVVLGLPEGCEFGVDLKSWKTGPNFRGVKMIPPGLHAFYYDVCNVYGDVAPRVSFLRQFNKSDMTVYKWDSEAEELRIQELSEEEMTKFKSNLYEMDRFLGPYPYEIFNKWRSLVANITDKLVKRVTPECGVIRSAVDLVRDTEGSGEEACAAEATPSNAEPGNSGSDKPRGTGAESDAAPACSDKDAKLKPERVRRRRRTWRDSEAGLLPNLTPAPGTKLRFTTVPEDQFPVDCTPADITRHSIDPTFTLDTVISSMDNEREYAGESELSFILFLVGLSLDALEAWKRLVVLACRCESAVERRPRLYGALLGALSAQLDHIPEDFLVDIVESENVIYSSLRQLFRTTTTNQGVDRRLKSTASKLSQKLSERFEWDFNDLEEDEEDEAPVVVELTDHID